MQDANLSIDQKRNLFIALMEFYKYTYENKSSNKPVIKRDLKPGEKQWVPPGSASSSAQSKSVLTEKDIFNVLYNNDLFNADKVKKKITEKNAKYSDFANEIDRKIAEEEKTKREAAERVRKAAAEKAAAAAKEAADKAAADKAAAAAKEAADKAAAAAKEAADKAEEQKAAAEEQKTAAEEQKTAAEEQKTKEVEEKEKQRLAAVEKQRLAAEETAKREAEEAATETETTAVETESPEKEEENTRQIIIGHFELNNGTAVFIEDNPQPSPELPLNPTKPEIYSFHKKYYYTKSNPNEFYEYK